MTNHFFLPRRTLLLAALGSLLPGVSLAAEGSAVLEKFLAQVSGAEGAFRQETRDRTGKITNAAEGTFAFLRPGAFDWLYEKPWRQRIVSDGKTIWVYDEDLMQVTVKPAGDALAQTPAALLFGAGKLPAALCNSIYKALSVDRPGGLCFVRVNYRLYSSVYFLVR